MDVGSLGKRIVILQLRAPFLQLHVFRIVHENGDVGIAGGHRRNVECLVLNLNRFIANRFVRTVHGHLRPCKAGSTHVHPHALHVAAGLVDTQLQFFDTSVRFNLEIRPVRGTEVIDEAGDAANAVSTHLRP